MVTRLTKHRKQKIIKALGKKGFSDPESYDIESLWDSSLTYNENFENIVGKVIEEVKDEEMIRHYELEAQRQLEQQILDKIGDNVPILNFKEVNEEIENFTCLGCEYTYSTLFALLNNTSIINYGNVGCGKSRSTVELLKFINMPKTLIFSGYITAKRFFRVVSSFNDCLICFDEGDLILHNGIINQMLKSIFTSSKAVWETDREDLESDFSGSLIINCNKFKFDKGIEDKVLVNQKGLSTEDYKEKIKQGRTYIPNKDVWESIRERIVYVRNNGGISLDDKEKELLYQFIFDLPVIDSYRIKHRVFDIFTSLKKLYGVMNKDVFELGKRLSYSMLNTDVVIKILSEFDDKIERKVLVERIANAKSISTRQAQRIINDLIKRDILKKINRTTLSK